MYEEYGNLRGDRLLNVEQLFGEVLANVLGDFKLRASGIFYDIDKFEGEARVLLTAVHSQDTRLGRIDCL